MSSKGAGIESAEAAAEAKAPYWDPPPAPLLDTSELTKWSLYRALIAEFMATLIFLYVSIATVIGYKTQSANDACTGLSLVRTVLYIIAQCLGAICGAGIVRGLYGSVYDTLQGGTNSVDHVGSALGAEILGTFVLVYTVFSATDPKRTARDSFIPVLVPLPIGFAVFVVHLATIPITGTGINPARSLGPAVIYNNAMGWKHHWVFWVGPLIGAAAAALYHKLVLRGEAAKALGSFRGTSATV
nr:unnamed protein product [Digitaria exilis]CAB3457739.1 unnamed protein product [Digitaria exilis]